MSAQEPEQLEPRGFSKALKRATVGVIVTVHDPERGTPIEMMLGFRRMTDGETTAMQERNAARLATATKVTEGEIEPEDVNTASETEHLVDVLAPLFVEQRGIDDWPNGDGTPEQRFRRYFLGDGSESAEDLEVEAKIVRAAFLGYLHGAFRLIPTELQQAFSLPRGGDDVVRGEEGNGAGADVRLPTLPKRRKTTRKRGKL